MSDDHECTFYCEGDVHALMLTGRAGVTLAMLERWAECYGYVLHEVRRAIEVDLATEQAKRNWNWDPVTGAVTPYLPADSLPTDEVWMVRVSLAPREETYPRAGWAWSSVRWRHLLWWRRH